MLQIHIKNFAQEFKKTGLKIKIFLVLLAVPLTLGLIFKNPESLNAQNYITEGMEKCAESAGSNKCFESFARDLLGRYSLTKILEVLGENETKPKFFDKCHLLSHYLGREEYRRKGSVRKVFEESSRICLAGTYHGAVEGYFIEKGFAARGIEDGIIAKEVPNICGNKKDYQRPIGFVECNHGMGHALMFLTQNDLIRSLKLCDSLKSNEEQQLCYTGAYMQNADNGKSSLHPSKYYEGDDYLYPCQILEERYLQQCYTYYVLTRFQDSLEKSIEACKNVPALYQSDCFKTIGRDRPVATVSVEEIKKQCLQIESTPFIMDCIRGASYNLVVRYDYTSSFPLEFCRILEDPYKKPCYQELGRAVKNTAGKEETRQSTCRKINEPDYINNCLGE